LDTGFWLKLENQGRIPSGSRGGEGVAQCGECARIDGEMIVDGYATVGISFVVFDGKRREKRVESWQMDCDQARWRLS
jgi:hypothetical protein